MPIVFQCECGHPYDLEDVIAGRTIHCLSCKKPITAPFITPAVFGDKRRLEPESVKNPPSIKREFNLTDLALVGGSCMMIAAVLWYFVGFRWFGGDRYYPAGTLFVAGLVFMFSRIAADMDGPRD